MPYNNGSRYNRQLKQRQPKRNVWRREDSASAATKENADATTSTSTAAATGATDAGNGRTFKLSAEAKPFVKKLNAKAEPFVSRKRLTSDRLEEIERKKRELQEKIRAKKRKIEEDERFRKKQKALRDAAKHSQQVAEQKAKIARLQGMNKEANKKKQWILGLGLDLDLTNVLLPFFLFSLFSYLFF